MKDKIEIAKQRIIEIANRCPEGLFVGNSGGKDSSTVLHLANSVLSPKPDVIHNTKTLYKGYKDKGPTDVDMRTLEYLYTETSKQANRLIIIPSKRMGDYVKEFNLKTQIDGTRSEEFNREGKSTHFVHNGIEISRDKMSHWNENGLFGLNFLYPIFDWSSEDVFNYHKINNIPLSDEYIDDIEYLDWKIKN